MRPYSLAFGWSIFLVLGLLAELKGFYRHLTGKEKQPEFLVLFGFLLPFMALSSSRYQLPHYAFMVYPLGAIIAAKYIIQIFYTSTTSRKRPLYLTHIILILLALAFVFVLVWFSFQDMDPMAAAVYVVALLLFSYVAFLWKNPYTVVIASVVMILFANLALNSIFYPRLLKYQAGSELTIKALEAGAGRGTLYSYRTPISGSMDFYANMTVPIEEDLNQLAARKNIWVYTREEFVAEIINKRPDAAIVAVAGDYSVTLLTAEFLNPTTRESTLRKAYLIKL